MPHTPQALAVVLGRLDRVKEAPGGCWSARCPAPGHAHNDRKASLSVVVGVNGGVLLKCFTGCTVETILAALGLEWADLWDRDSKGRQIRRYSVLGRDGTTYYHVRKGNGDAKAVHWEDAN